MNEKSRAISKYIRIAPRKARLAASLIRGRRVEEAFTELQYSDLKGARLLLKTLKSAVANAETQAGVQRQELVVSEVRVDEGPTMKRAKSKCKGGRVPVLKRTSHLTVAVGTN